MSSDSGFQDSVDRTREAFRRSAPEGHEPATPRPEPAAPHTDHDPARMEPSASHDAAPALHPFFQGLLETLPPPGADWPRAKREQWLETARSIFALVYTDPSEQRPALRLLGAPPDTPRTDPEPDRYSA